MICIYCLHKKTAVINSRPHKKLPLIWRRRQCQKCHKVWTTEESVDLSRIYRVTSPETKQTRQFSFATLHKSIQDVLAYADLSPDRAYELARAVADNIVVQFRPQDILTTQDIAAAAFGILNNYNKLAALAYASRYGIVVKRPGRPPKTA